MNPVELMKKWMPFILAGIFLFWLAPEIFSNRLNSESTPQRILIDHQVLGLNVRQSVYSRAQAESVLVQYHKAYFDFKMRGIYRVGIQLRDGKFVILKQLNTTLQYEPSLVMGPDLEIKHRQALEEARKVATVLQLPVQE